MIIEDELKTGVEGTIGRRVETVVGATRLDPDLSLVRSRLEASQHARGRDDARALGAQQRQMRTKIAVRRQRNS